MIVLNVIVLMAVAFVCGYFIGKGKVNVTLVPTKAKRKELDRKYEQEIKDIINEYNKALADFNDLGV